MCPFGIARSPRHKGSFHSQSLFYEYPLGTHTHKKDWEQDRKLDRAPFSGPSVAAGETHPVNSFLLWNNSLKVLKEEQQILSHCLWGRSRSRTHPSLKWHRKSWNQDSALMLRRDQLLLGDKNSLLPKTNHRYKVKFGCQWEERKEWWENLNPHRGCLKLRQDQYNRELPVSIISRFMQQQPMSKAISGRETPLWHRQAE